MSSVQSHLIRLFLRVQKLAQRGATIESTRRLGERIGRFYSLPKDMRWEKVIQGNLIHEWLTPKAISSPIVIFYIHGGGFVFPLWNPGRRTIAYLARIAGIRTLLVDYRLAPEHPFPAAVDDCVTAYRWLISDGGIAPERVIFVGESAGGNLVLTTMLALRDAGDLLPIGAAAICPVFEFEGTGTFYTVDDPMAHADFVMLQLQAYRGKADPHNPLLSPLYADLQGLPPIFVQIGEEEILRSAAVELAARAKQAGVPTTLETWPRMWHFWHLFVPFLPEAREAMETIKEFLHSRSKQTEVIQLRIPQWDDMQFIRWLWNDPETMKPVGGPIQLTDDQARRWYAGMVEPGSPTDRYRLIFNADRPIGEISFHRLDPDSMTADFNIKIADQERRKGYAREAMLLFLDYFFNQFGGRVLVDDVALENETGQQALLDFGFERGSKAEKAVRLRMTREQFNHLYGSAEK